MKFTAYTADDNRYDYILKNDTEETVKRAILDGGLVVRIKGTQESIWYPPHSIIKILFDPT